MMSMDMWLMAYEELARTWKQVVMTTENFSQYIRLASQESKPKCYIVGQSWQPMARVKIFLSRGIHCCSNFFSRPSLLYYEEMYIIIYEGVDVAYGHHYYQMMLRVNSFFIQTRSGEKLLFA
jgi:hypothetical protein